MDRTNLRDALSTTDVDLTGGAVAGPSVDGVEVDRKRIERTVAGRFGIDTFGVGVDTGAPVSKNYKPPFAYEGIIDSIEIEIGDAGLDPDEEAKLHAQFRAGKEY
jgi:arylsulfatase